MGNRVQAAQYYEQAIAVDKWQTSYYLGPLYTVNPKRALELCVEEVMRWKEMCDDSANAEILTEYGLLLLAIYVVDGTLTLESAVLETGLK